MIVRNPVCPENVQRLTDVSRQVPLSPDGHDVGVSSELERRLPVWKHGWVSREIASPITRSDESWKVEKREESAVRTSCDVRTAGNVRARDRLQD